jgi:hypothetical protein
VLLCTLLKIAVNNTHILAINMNIDTTLKQTTLSIIDHLKQNHTMRNDTNRPTYQQRTTGFGHFPDKIDGTSKDCVFCLHNQKRSKTKYLCTICQVPLHIDCWIEYHNK